MGGFAAVAREKGARVPREHQNLLGGSLGPLGHPIMNGPIGPWGPDHLEPSRGVPGALGAPEHQKSSRGVPGAPNYEWAPGAPGAQSTRNLLGGALGPWGPRTPGTF